MNKYAAQQMAKDLLAANDVRQFFEVLGKYYDLEGAKLGPITKRAFLSKMDTLVKATGAKPRKQYL